VTDSTVHARVPDEALRIHALEALGPLGDVLARVALEEGSVLVEHDVLAWEGSHGTVHAHRVIVVLPADVHARFATSDASSHAAKDALAAALAATMAERAGHAVADVVLEAGIVEHAMSGPYRDPRAGRT
jgi:hypothetical protein